MQQRVGQLEVGKLFPRVSVEKIFANLNWPIDYETAKQEAIEKFIVPRLHRK